MSAAAAATQDNDFCGSLRRSTGALIPVRGRATVTRGKSDHHTVEIGVPGLGVLRVELAPSSFTDAAFTLYGTGDRAAPHLHVHAPPNLAVMRAHICHLDQALIVTSWPVNKEHRELSSRLVMLFERSFFARMYELALGTLGARDSLLVLPQLVPAANTRELANLHADRTTQTTAAKPRTQADIAHAEREASRDRGLLRFVALVCHRRITEHTMQQPAKHMHFTPLLSKHDTRG